jgi:hypothetical protein
MMTTGIALASQERVVLLEMTTGFLDPVTMIGIALANRERVDIMIIPALDGVFNAS